MTVHTITLSPHTSATTAEAVVTPVSVGSQGPTSEVSQDSELFILVNTLYGPGTVGSWFLILCSVVISWTLNPREVKRDHITNDFVAAMIFPCIASAHLAYLLFQLPAPLLDVVTSHNLEMRQQAAAIGAPFNICEAFPSFALLLFTIAAWQRHFKRGAIVFAVGVLSWVMVNVFFLGSQAKNTERREINIQHGSLDAEGLSFAISWVVFLLVLVPTILIGCCIGTVLVWMKATAVLSSLATAIGFIVAISASSDLLTGTGHKKTDGIRMETRPFFFPRTNVSIQSLDQVVALCAGCITLLFSVYEAFRTSRNTIPAQEIQEARAAQSRNENGIHRRRSI